MRTKTLVALILAAALLWYLLQLAALVDPFGVGYPDAPTEVAPPANELPYDPPDAPVIVTPEPWQEDLRELEEELRRELAPQPTPYDPFEDLERYRRDTPRYDPWEQRDELLRPTPTIPGWDWRP